MRWGGKKVRPSFCTAKCTIVWSRVGLIITEHVRAFAHTWACLDSPSSSSIAPRFFHLQQKPLRTHTTHKHTRTRTLHCSPYKEAMELTKAVGRTKRVALHTQCNICTKKRVRERERSAKHTNTAIYFPPPPPSSPLFRRGGEFSGQESCNRWNFSTDETAALPLTLQLWYMTLKKLLHPRRVGEEKEKIEKRSWNKRW